MRLVKLELRDAPFWFLSDSTNTVFIALHSSSPVSGLLDVDSLDDHFFDVINASARQLEIQIIDSENRKLRSLNDVVFLDDGEFSVDTENDIPLDNSDFPEIVSVTIENDKEEEEEKEEIVYSLTPEMQEDVKILLEKNGNTIKKMIRNLSKTKENLFFLEQCKKIERANQNRQGVVLAIQTVITECK
jgi:hypothetical protein